MWILFSSILYIIEMKTKKGRMVNLPRKDSVIWGNMIFI